MVTDTLEEGLELVDGSVTINGGAATSYTYDKATRLFTYTFPDPITTQQIITFKTKVTDLAKYFAQNGDKYIPNKATLTHEVGGREYTVDSSTTQKIINTVVSKAGVADFNKNRYITWNININQNAQTLTDVVLTDTLRQYLELDTSSIRLFKQTIDQGGNLTPDLANPIDLTKDNISYDPSSRQFTFTMPTPISEPYLLTFRTDVTVTAADLPAGTDEIKFTNSIMMAGSGKVNTADSDEFTFNVATYGGKGFGATGSMTIIKVDDDNPLATLEGARFAIYDRYDNKMETKTTGTEGTLTFDRLRFDVDYTIIEEDAPEGYFFTENQTSYLFQISGSAGAEKNLTHQWPNVLIPTSPDEIVLRASKTMDGVKPEAGAFTFYLKNEAGEIIDTQTNDADGNIVFKDLNLPENYPAEYIYTISEEAAGNTKIRYDYAVYTVKITVDKNPQFPYDEHSYDYDIEISYLKNGQPYAGAAPVFMNHTRTSDKTVDLSVEKVWKGDQAEDRPGRVRVQLYRDGKAYGSSAALSERNDWSYTWDNLSDNYEWTVDEIAVPDGYTKKVIQDGADFIITNTKKDDVTIPEPEPPTEPGEPTVPTGPAEPDDDTGILDAGIPGHGLDASPDTGDNFPSYLWLLLGLAGFTGTACAWRAAKTKSRHN